MSTHTAITDYYAGATLDAGSELCHRTTDSVLYTANDTPELTAGGGVYAPEFNDVAAGSYRLKLKASGEVVATRLVKFAGTNNEVVLTGVNAELDSSALGPVLEAIDNYVSSVVAGAQLAVGTIVGFPTTLAIGDSYTDDCNSAIHVFIRDANDDPVTAVGDHEFTDTDFAPECTITLSGNTGKVKATVTYVDPSAGESYLKIQIPPKESRRATPGVATVQVVLKWSDSRAQKTLSSQAVTWTNQL